MPGRIIREIVSDEFLGEFQLLFGVQIRHSRYDPTMVPHVEIPGENELFVKLIRVVSS